MKRDVSFSIVVVLIGFMFNSAFSTEFSAASKWLQARIVRMPGLSKGSIAPADLPFSLVRRYPVRFVNGRAGMGALIQVNTEFSDAFFLDKGMRVNSRLNDIYSVFIRKRL